MRPFLAFLSASRSVSADFASSSLPLLAPRSYAIPGHRLGALVASPTFLAQVSKTLDCLQICPARPAQRAVEWAVDATRPWREATRNELARRQVLFKELLGEVDGWEVETGGAYFAYVRPSPSFLSLCPRVPAHARALARRSSTPSRARRPSSSRRASASTSASSSSPAPSSLRRSPTSTTTATSASVRPLSLAVALAVSSERAELTHEAVVRAAIANVDERTLRLVPDRLRELNALWPSLSSSAEA